MLECTRTLKAHKGGVLALAFNSDGNYCMSAGDDRRVLLWNPRREEAVAIKEYTGHNKPVHGVAVAPDNGSFASCGGDRAVFLWDVPSGRVTRRLAAHTQRVNAVAYNADGSVVVSGGYDTHVCCWDCRSRSAAPIQTLRDATDSVSSVAVGEADVLAASVDGKLRRYDLRAGYVSVDTVGSALTHVAPSRDGGCALVAGLDDTLRLLDKGDGTLLASYVGHANRSTKLACSLSHDDAHVLCGSEDGHVHMWELVDGKPLGKGAGHRAAVAALACDPRRRELVSWAYDGEIRLWAMGT